MLDDIKITESLLFKKRQIEKLTNDRARVEGELAQIMKQLKALCKCKSIEDCTEKLNSLKKDIQSQEKELEERLTILEEKYDWN